MQEYDVIVAETVRRYTTWRVRLTDDEARELGDLENVNMDWQDRALINNAVNRSGGKVVRVDHYETDEPDHALIGVDAADETDTTD